MNQKQMRSILQSNLKMIDELVEFCEESIDLIFGEDAPRAKGIFETYVESFDQECWVIRPNNIKTMIAEDKKRAQEYKEKNEKKKG